MNRFKQYVANRTDEEKRQIIFDYEQFVNDGHIGNCTLRNVSREYINFLGCRLPITEIMKDVAIECYRHFAEKYFTTTDKLANPFRGT